MNIHNNQGDSQHGESLSEPAIASQRRAGCTCRVWQDRAAVRRNGARRVRGCGPVTGSRWSSYGQLTAPSAAPMVTMIAPPSVTEMNERRKPVPRNRRRIQASVTSSSVIAASASSTAAR
jgi:hypothetical protein